MKMKRYSKDFRLQAARLVTEQGYSYAEVAERLGPSAWSVKYRRSETLSSFWNTLMPPHGLSSQ